MSFLQPCDKNVTVLRKLNQHIFPVQYRDRFYDDCLAAGVYTSMGEHLHPPTPPLLCALRVAPSREGGHWAGWACAVHTPIDPRQWVASSCRDAKWSCSWWNP